MRRISILVALVVLLFIGSLEAQTQTVHYTWTPPTTGSAVHHYLVQHSLNGGAWVQVASVTAPAYDLAESNLDSHSIRVCGVDKVDRQGPWSTPSDLDTPDAGPPGGCGKPGKS
jgi:hypothetical protein